MIFLRITGKDRFHSCRQGTALINLTLDIVILRSLWDITVKMPSRLEVINIDLLSEELSRF